MPGSNWQVEEDVGLVVEPPNKTRPPRVGILWADSEVVDWEPVSWLEVISESR